MTAKKGKSLDDFRNVHDKSVTIPKKINAALSELGESWEYQVDFLKTAGVSGNDLAPYKEQFADFWFMTGGGSPKTVWAGTAKFCKSLKESLR